MFEKFRRLFWSKKAHKAVQTTGLLCEDVSTQTEAVYQYGIDAATSTSEMEFAGNGYKHRFNATKKNASKKYKFK